MANFATARAEDSFLVDAKDWEWLQGVKDCSKAKAYVVIGRKEEGRRKFDNLSRVIYLRAGGYILPGEVVDHINGNKNDYRRRNLQALPAGRNKAKGYYDDYLSGKNHYISKAGDRYRVRYMDPKTKKDVLFASVETLEEAEKMREKMVKEVLLPGFEGRRLPC